MKYVPRDWLCVASKRFVQSRRDLLGWRIPREGTRGSQVYDLLCKGMKVPQIASILGITKVHAEGLAYKIRNPDKANSSAARRMKRKRERKDHERSQRPSLS